MGQAKRRAEFKGDDYKKKQQTTHMVRQFSTSKIACNQSFITADGKRYYFDKHGTMRRMKHG